MTLDEVECGERAVIDFIEDGGGATRRIRELGIVAGTELRVIRRAPAGDPIEIEVRGYMLTLRREMAKKISVRAEN